MKQPSFPMLRRFILWISKRLGYVVLKSSNWESDQQRLAAFDKEKQDLLAKSASKEADLDKRLAICAHEKQAATLRVGRMEVYVKALRRRSDALEAELENCRRQLAQVDMSGRIRDLELENHRIRQRAHDLETFLKEAEGRSNYL